MTPNIEIVKDEIMRQITEAAHDLVYGGKLDRAIYQAVETNKPLIHVRVTMPVNINPEGTTDGHRRAHH